MALPKVLVLVLAGGKGNRLELLTEQRAKPAVPFAGVYRLIDFPLSNCQHSNLADVWVSVQHHPTSLSQHLANGRPAFTIVGLPDADGLLEAVEFVSGFLEAGVDPAGAGVFLVHLGGGDRGGQVAGGQLHDFESGGHGAVADEQFLTGVDVELVGECVGGRFGADGDLATRGPAAGVGLTCTGLVPRCGDRW